MRKKPTNLTLADAIRSRAERIMARQGFTSFSAFVEQLIREEHSRQFPDTLNDTAQPTTPTDAPPKPVTYKLPRQRKK